MDELKASRYLKGMKHNMATKNNYDTVSGKLLNNTPTAPAVYAEEEIDISNWSIQTWDTFVSQRNNSCNNSWSYREKTLNMAASTVAVRMKTVTCQFTTEDPLPDGAYAELEFEGETTQINEDFSVDSFINYFRNAASLGCSFFQPYITQEKVTTMSWSQGASEYVDYTQGKVNLFAWLKRAVQTGTTDLTRYVSATSSDYLNHRPAETDILTKWVKTLDYTTSQSTDPQTRAGATNKYADSTPGYQRWYGSWYSSRDGGTEERVTGTLTYPNTAAQYYNPDEANPKPTQSQRDSVMQQTIAYNEAYAYSSINVEKIDDYHFTVTATFPCQYMYVASAIGTRVSFWNGEDNEVIDSLGFVDHATKVTVKLYGQKLDENSTDFANSITSSGAITDPKNKNILRLKDNELLTKNNTWGGYDWKNYVVKYLLERYQNGLTTIELTMNMDDAIRYGVRVNSKYFIKDIENNTISRGYHKVIYIVKNITKKFNDTQAVWTLKLMESTEDTYAASLGAYATLEMSKFEGTLSRVYAKNMYGSVMMSTWWYHQSPITLSELSCQDKGGFANIASDFKFAVTCAFVHSVGASVSETISVAASALCAIIHKVAAQVRIFDTETGTVVSEKGIDINSSMSWSGIAQAIAAVRTGKEIYAKGSYTSRLKATLLSIAVREVYGNANMSSLYAIYATKSSLSSIYSILNISFENKGILTLSQVQSLNSQLNITTDASAWLMKVSFFLGALATITTNVTGSLTRARRTIVDDMDGVKVEGLEGVTLAEASWKII
jgi:hypothetical protein